MKLTVKCLFVPYALDYDVKFAVGWMQIGKMLMEYLLPNGN